MRILHLVSKSTPKDGHDRDESALRLYVWCLLVGSLVCIALYVTLFVMLRRALLHSLPEEIPVIEDDSDDDSDDETSTSRSKTE